MTADMPNWSRAITLHEWRQLMAGRRRNLTDKHPGLRNTQPDTAPSSNSLLDTYLAKEEGNE
jgi:hypothetical protein